MTTILREATSSHGERELRRSMERAWADLDRLDAAALRRVRDRIAEFRADVLDRLAGLPTTTVDGVETFQATSLRAFAAELDAAAARYAQRASVELGNDLRAAGAMSDAAHRDALSALARATGVPPSMIVLSPLGIADEQIEAAVLFSNSAITNVSQAVIQTVNAELQRVVFGGGSRWQAVQNIRAALGTTGQNVGPLTKRAESIARTGLIAALNVSAEHSYRQALDELPGLMKEWMTAKDRRVDPKCAALNGQRAKPGEPFSGGVMAPPLHQNCRCRTVAWLPAWGKR